MYRVVSAVASEERDYCEGYSLDVYREEENAAYECEVIKEVQG